MRRRKYFYEETYLYDDYVTKQKEKAGTIQCTNNKLVYVWDGVSDIPCLNGGADCYTPVELDPYWKNIVDETNRRLYDR